MAKIGDKIDTLHALREEKRSLEEHVKLIVAKMEELEAEIIEDLDFVGLDKATGSSNTASVSIGEQDFYTIDDEERFYAFIHRYRYYHLLERRAARAACRELYQKKGSIPGIVPVVKRKLNLRSL